MKKRLMLLALTGFLLSGCGEPRNNEPINPPDENEDNDDKPDNPDIDPGDEEEVINPDITPFTKISELTKYINETVPALEQNNGVTFAREFIYSYEDIYATVTREIKETGTSYSNDTLVIKGERTLSRDYPEDDYLEDEKETDTYDSITSLKDGVYYSVVDYKESNDNDDSYKEDYNAKNESKYKENTSLSTYKNLSSYLDDYVKGKYVTNGASDKVTSTVDTTSGNFVTTFTMTDETENEYGKYLTEASFTVNFLKDGNFAGFLFEYDEYAYGYDALGNYTDETFLISSITEKVTLGYGDKTEYDFSELDPVDYFMTDFDVNVCVFDTILGESTPADINAFPYDKYISVEATNVVPEKTIDKNLEIVNSSNQEVIAESYGQFKAIGLGKTTLTVKSTYGLTKEIEVTVVAPDLTAISPRFTSELHFVGQDETLYIDYESENTLDKFYIKNLNEDVVNVGEIEDLVDGIACADLEFLKAGKATLEFYREKDNKLLNSITFEVVEALTDEEMKSNLIGTWYGDLENTHTGEMIKEAVKIEFIDESKAELTLLSDDTGFTLDVNKPYELNYSFKENAATESRKDRMEIEFSDLKFMVADKEYIYDSNAGFYYRDGKTLLISFTISDSHQFGFTLEFDAYKK